MKMIEIYSLPQLKFAHIFYADCYNSHFEKMQNRMEITYIDDGQLELEVDGVNYVACKGDIICMLHNTEYIVRAPKFHRHHTVCVSVEWNFVENNINCFHLPIITRATEGTEQIRQMIDMFIYKPEKFENSTIRTSHQFLSILAKIDACNRDMKELKVPSDWILVENAKKYIHRHLQQPITQAEIADVLHISTSYLCRIFKRTQGIPLMQYVNYTKLRSMKSLMEKEHLKLYEVAHLYGYTDANYVSRLYKKLFGHNITDKPKLII